MTYVELKEARKVKREIYKVRSIIRSRLKRKYPYKSDAQIEFFTELAMEKNKHRWSGELYESLYRNRFKRDS